MNELHAAARIGCVERAVALLSRGVIDINEGASQARGMTPLMIAASFGHPRVVRVLLNNGADLSMVNDDGGTALHGSAEGGYLEVTKLLVKAGADLDARISPGRCTPLYMAAKGGHSEVAGVLVDAGADPNTRRLGGATPLYKAAEYGHAAATKVLIRAKANPLLARSDASGVTLLPLDVAAMKGHFEVVYELIQGYRIEGCGGASGGVNALKFAAAIQHVEVMNILTSAGVVDPGVILIGAATSGHASSVKLLLQRQEWKVGYVDTMVTDGLTPLVGSIRAYSPRTTRLLVDAGADTATTVRLKHGDGEVFFNGTPLAFVDLFLAQNNVGGKDATESQLHALEATRRLLLRVEAVHAVSWLWAKDAPSTTHAATKGTHGASVTTPTPLTFMFPVLRRRASRPRVLLAALFRWAVVGTCEDTRVLDRLFVFGVFFL